MTTRVTNRRLIVALASLGACLLLAQLIGSLGGVLVGVGR